VKGWAERLALCFQAEQIEHGAQGLVPGGSPCP